MLKSGLQIRIPALHDASCYQLEFSDHLYCSLMSSTSAPAPWSSASEGTWCPLPFRNWAVGTSLPPSQFLKPWPELFLSIPCCMTLRTLASFSIFSLCSLRNWRTSLHPWASEKAHDSLFPEFKFEFSIWFFHQRIVRKGAGRKSWRRMQPRTVVLPPFPEA